jgi:DNA polymerase II large subunit
MPSWTHDEYIDRLKSDADAAYEIAEAARAKGLDPRIAVEIPQAFDLADRCQKLLEFLHPRRTAEQIRSLTDAHDGNREMVALDIARIVTAESWLYGVKQECEACGGEKTVKKGRRTVSCDACDGTGMRLDYSEGITTDYQATLERFESEEVKIKDETLAALCIYHGVCAGLAVLTEGILVAPLEGVVSCRIVTNEDRSKSLAINYAGPIRSAGGTGQALSVLIGDIIRRDFGLVPPQITFEEAERYKEEVSKYSRGLQYRPSNPQLEVIAYNCPVYIDGEGVGDEVSGQRDLPRVPTNKVREGMLLVMCEGLVLKAPKILKYTEALGFEEWSWLNQFTGSKSGESAKPTIEPNYKFLGDVLAGRPIFSQPMQRGGFRLRYGRSRLAGLATTAIHPASMRAVGSFLIVGTQMKYERPGKATVVTPCDSIEGPYVEFADGSARRIQNMEDLPDANPTEEEWNIARIWDLGEILVPVGEFLENNHPLAPSPYVKEWHELEIGKQQLTYPTNFAEALEQAQNLGVPMAPEYVAHFADISSDELIDLLQGISVDSCAGTATVADEVRDLIYRLNIDITAAGQISGTKSSLLLHLWSQLNTLRDFVSNLTQTDSALETIQNFCAFEVRNPVSIRIGGRMGKPEGSKLREMKPPIHCNFPVGFNVGSLRLLRTAADQDEQVETGWRMCDVCETETIWGVCCGQETRFVGLKWESVGLKSLYESALETAEIADGKIKGVKGITSGEKIPEHPLKGILRFKHGISTFRDGTIRFDMVDITMTHFRPREIGMTVAQAQELGYDCSTPDDVLEIRPQDVVLPRNCSEQILATANYMDELLQKMYDLPAYYQCDRVEDLIGHYVMGIAPHTSGAILARIIGFADIKGHYGHHYFHAAKRRNCDGDIDAVLLLMDGLINFSKKFLPGHRGGQMDAPLILTTKIVPSEIDKEALNVEIVDRYPIEFYELTLGTHDEDGDWIPAPAKAAVAAGVTIVESVLGTDLQYVGQNFTHDTSDCAEGPANNPYNTLDSMRQKTMAQFALGDCLESVDNVDQSSRLINRHLIRDMRGNLRAYGQQKVRCPKCAAKYRRPPISGQCMTVLETKQNPFSGETEEIRCDGRIILTVTHGAVAKYDKLMAELVTRYGADNYTEGLYEQVSRWVKDTFEDKNILSQSALPLPEPTEDSDSN